jgi:hypothetical protein
MEHKQWVEASVNTAASVAIEKCTKDSLEIRDRQFPNFERRDRTLSSRFCRAVGPAVLLRSDFAAPAAIDPESPAKPAP